MTFKYTFGHYANKRFVERIPQFHAEYRYGHCSHIRCSHAHVLVQTHIQTHTLSSTLQSKHICMHYTQALSHIHRRTHTASIILLYTTHPRAKQTLVHRHTHVHNTYTCAYTNVRAHHHHRRRRYHRHHHCGSPSQAKTDAGGENAFRA